jgi:hypothetical protein
MPRFLIHHRHEPQQCSIAFANFKGHASPLRHRTALSSCQDGDHGIWWTVEAAGEEDALRQLPFFVAQHSTVTRVTEVLIP